MRDWELRLSGYDMKRREQLIFLFKVPPHSREAIDLTNVMTQRTCIRRQRDQRRYDRSDGKWMIFGYPLLAMLVLLLFAYIIGVRQTDVSQKYPLRTFEYLRAAV